MNRLFRTPSGDLRWGWKTAILIVGTILFGVILTAILISALTIGYSSQGFNQDQAMEKATLASGGFIAQVVLSALQLVFMLWLVRWLITKVERRKFEWSKLGLISNERSKYITLGMVSALVLSLFTIGIGYIFGALKFLGNGFELFGSAQVLTTLLLAIILAFASGFGEEIAFRGYLQSRITQRYNFTVAVVIVAVLFALSHPLGNSSDPLLYLASAILVGILFGVTYARTGSLWMGIALHALWNYLQIAVVAIRNRADERFFGAPLLVFDTISGTAQMWIELTVILVGLLFIFWLTKPVTKSWLTKGQNNASPYL
ncbi:MAG: CPBP family intramembrane glutamic endopeptidase [Anaerolineales bacterium]